jgi:hypothetical protein
MKRLVLSAFIAAAILGANVSVAAQQRVSAGVAVTKKTVGYGSGGSVVIRTYGLPSPIDGVYSDNANVAEAVELYARSHPGTPIQATVAVGVDGLTIVASEFPYEHTDSPTGPPPPTPGEPPTGTASNISTVRDIIHQNGYTRTTDYTRTVTPDQSDPGQYVDGDWYISMDHLDIDGGGGGGGCPAGPEMGCNPSVQNAGGSSS